MKFKGRLIFTLLLTYLPVLCLDAQTGNGAREKICTFRAVAWNREIPDVHYLSGKKQLSVDLHRGVISEKMSCDGDGRLTLWAGPVPQSDAAKRAPLASVMLRPEPAGNLVIMWIDKKERPQTIVLSDEPESFAPGQARFVNVTRYPLSISCNDQILMLDPGATKVVPGDGRGVRLKVAIQKNSRGEWQLAAMNAVRVRPDTRVSVFIADPEEMAVSPEEKGKEILRGQLSLFVVSDRVPSPVKSP
jgi:hypothetical protein